MVVPWLFRTTGVLLCASSAAVPILAQSATQGALAGSITDSSGAAIANTTLQLESVDSHAVVTLVSGPDGRFSAPALDPGSWTVTTRIPTPYQSLAGQLQIEIHVGRISTLALILTPTLLQSVTVNAQSEDDQQDSTLATTISPRQIAELPVNARSWGNFALLAPTAAPDATTGAAGLDLSFRALPGSLNYRTLDGASNSAAFAAPDNPRTRAAFTVSQSAVREFQVNVSNYSAQYGRAGGAVIDTVTQRGTAALHGNAFFYDRDNSWLSRTPGLQLLLPQPDGVLVPQKLPADYRLQGGLAAGGSIPHAHSFFWHYTYDQQDRNDPALSLITNAPQLSLSQAQASQYPGDNTACSELTGGPSHTGPLNSTGSEIDPSLYGTQGACFLLVFDGTLYPDYASASAAYNNGLAYIYSLLGEAPRRSTLISNLPRIDLALPHNNTLTLAWNAIRSHAPGGGDAQPFVSKSVTSLGNDHLALDDVSARFNSLLSPRIDNELRLGYARDSESESAQQPLPQEPRTALDGTAPPGVRISGTLTLGTPDQLPRAQYPRETRLQFADAVSFTHAHHTVRVGVDFLHTADTVAALESQAGYYRYDNIQDLLIDQASQAATSPRHCGDSPSGTQYLCYSSYEQAFGSPSLSFSGNLYAAYAQDDWRISPTFTLTLGFRYDYQLLPAPQVPNPILPATQTFHADRNNLAPRFGFALRLPHTQGTVLRGGYGLFYATTPATLLFNALAITGTASAQARGQARYTFNDSNLLDAPHYPNTAPTQPAPPTGPNPPPGPNVTVLAPEFQQPSVQQASLTLEHALSRSTTLHATGLLSLARDLPIVIDTNLAPPGSTPLLPTTVTYQFSGGPLNNVTETVPFYPATKPFPRPNVNFGSINTVESCVNATYSALTFGISHTARQLDLRAHYTWAHAIDYGEQTSASATHSEVLDPFNFRAERGDSILNRPSRFVLAAIWTPTLATSAPRSLRIAANGWHLSPIFQIASGAPYSATVVGTAPSQENSIGSQTISPVSSGYLGAGGADFLPLLGRNRFHQPYTQLMDLRLSRRIPLGSDRIHLEAAAEAFNLLNHLNISSANSESPVNTIAYRIGSQPNSGRGTAATPAIATYQPNFGQPISVNATNLFSARQLQFTIRAEF